MIEKYYGKNLVHVHYKLTVWAYVIRDLRVRQGKAASPLRSHV